jgi:hypothetical protein
MHNGVSRFGQSCEQLDKLRKERDSCDFNATTVQQQLESLVKQKEEAKAKESKLTEDLESVKREWEAPDRRVGERSGELQRLRADRDVAEKNERDEERELKQVCGVVCGRMVQSPTHVPQFPQLPEFICGVCIVYVLIYHVCIRFCLRPIMLVHAKSDHFGQTTLIHVLHLTIQNVDTFMHGHSIQCDRTSLEISGRCTFKQAFRET